MRCYPVGANLRRMSFFVARRPAVRQKWNWRAITLGGANMAQLLFQRISPADFKSLLKKVAIAEKALADLRSELNDLAGIKPSVEHQRRRPDQRIHSVLLDD